MIKNKAIQAILGSSLSILLLMSCGSQPEKKQTLASIDKAHARHKKATPSKPLKSKADVKQAYYDYIKGADKDDKLRVRAATRIAELELGADTDEGNTNPSHSDVKFEKTIRNTIRLLSDTLRDFPDSSNNDHIMYQLAKAHDQVAQGEQAIAVLDVMVKKYPKTRYFIESKFRIAEYSFITQNYAKSEEAYTDVLVASDNAAFFEKALFKRGWARYKQERYVDALDDYYDAIYRHDFPAYQDLNKKEQAIFDEYFRAIGLAFSYMGGAPAIDEYLTAKDDYLFVYQAYRSVSGLQLKQERFSDSVATHQAYIDRYPTGSGVIQSGLAIVDIWKHAGLFNRYTSAFETFYDNYNKQSNFWAVSGAKISSKDKKKAGIDIRSNIVVLSSHHHKRYNKKPSPKQFKTTQIWYKRYLRDYSSYAKKDQIYPLYAELLKRSGRRQQALPYYELTAFDGDIILNKESAYASIYITDHLLKNSPRASKKDRKSWLDKHIHYAFLYGQLYSTEARSSKIIEHAVQLTFKDQRLKRTIELANILPDTASDSIAREVGLLKAQAYFNLGQYEDAEIMYQDLLSAKSLTQKLRMQLTNKLALSFYRQGEKARDTGDINTSARNFLKVYRNVPSSELAATAVYDAIALFMSNKMWDEAIDYLNVFKREYPKHRYQKEVGRKLSVAYLKSNRSLEAAREFEKLSDFVSNQDEKMAALWQAAKLYHEKNDLKSALRAYKQYAHTYKRPYAENMEAMNIISKIYQKQGAREKRYFWLRKMVKSDKKAVKSNKTDRTRYIAAHASYSMALLRLDDFERIKLKNPLAKSLKNKKVAMQDTVKLFGQSAEYGHEEFVTSATYYIGDIYRHFSVALLESDRPKGLNEDELEQYDILLEDQAFPFEDKAIEFYETNMTRIAGGNFDKSIKKSLKQLRELFPARYARPGKVELFVEQL